MMLVAGLGGIKCVQATGSASLALKITDDSSTSK